ncbi:ubiquitin-protein ligase E3C [Dermacentor andersoni]|uniref:ubiquitin-protein ligase E3C n=1 Tax=Dermacentor andersoni TaxID=34620 RepID=UPI003B3B8B49
MYSFEGEFRKRPQQSLGGASKKVGLDDLLRKSALRRQNREECRRQEEAALKIKAFARGFLSRQRLAHELRQGFDANSRVSSDLGPLLRSLPLFYNANLDMERLAWLSHQVLLRKDEVASQADDPVWRLRIRRLLALNVTSLLRPGFPTVPALRLLEVLGAANAYHGCFRGTPLEEEWATQVRSWLQHLWLHLARQCNLFAHLHRLLEPRIPDPGPKEEGVPQVVTPQAQAMIDLLLQPLGKPVADGLECGDYQREIISCLLKGLLGDCPQVVRVVLPALASRWPYPGEPLLQAILGLRPSPWLFQALLRLSSPAEPLFIAAAAHLSPCLAHKVERSSREDLEADELSQADEAWSGGGGSSSTSLADEALEDVLEQLNVPATVNTFLEAAASSRENLPALCQLCWALVQRRPLALHHFRLLYTLAFRPQFLRQLWVALKDVRAPSLFVPGGTPVMQLLSSGICPPDNWAEPFSSQLNLFCSLLAHLLPTLHDVEFYESPAGDPMPFSLDELVSLIAQLRELCLGLLELCFPDTRTGLTPQQLQYLKTLWRPMFECVVSLLRQLYARDSRRPFCPDGHWVSPRTAICPDRVPGWNLEIQRLPTCGAAALTRKQLEEGGPPLTTTELRSAAILQEMPFAVPFPIRVRVLQSLIARDKSENNREQSHFLLGPQIEVMVRRDYIYEDAFEKLSGEPNLRLRLRVQLVNVAGLEEAGIDGGGLLREFLAELMKTAFDANRGLFRCTHDRRLYPNPAVGQLPDYADGRAARHYSFVGRLLGKALYEGMLVELPMAHFFLAKLVASGRGDLGLHHLASLEPLVYRNLFFLKSYKGDVADLGLDFTVVTSQLGNSTVEELKPNGATIPVTAANRIEYMHLLADHLLNAQLRQQCLAFRQGLEELLPGHWLRLFAPHELQVLISGAQSPVDLEDLREHTHYEGGYSATHPVVQAFWRVLASFDERQRRLLLKFVTSCSRPPLLGFKDLVPQFCIHSAGPEPGRLPTASTCMNLLKLPEITDEAQLREKLLYAIESGAGFELS